MSILKTVLVMVVTVMSLAQASSVQAEGMDMVKRYDLTRTFVVDALWHGHKKVWIGQYIGKNHSLVTADFQGVTIGQPSKVREQSGARLIETRYYADTGYVYTQIILDSNTGSIIQTGYHATVSITLTAFEGTSVNNARTLIN